MNASTIKTVRRKVPVAGSIQRPWPWQLFVLLVALGAVLLATHYFIKPALGLSLPSLSFRGDGCSAEFEAVNNTDQPVTAVVQVVFGFLQGKGPSFRELARTQVPIALMPRQRKNLACEFLPQNPRSSFLNYPNTARVEILSYRSQLYESTK